MTRNILLSITLGLSYSPIFASPTPHTHGERTHTHALPNIGITHTHGGLPAGKAVSGVIKTKGTQPVKNTKRSQPVKKVSSLDDRLYLVGIEVAAKAASTNVLAKFSNGDLDLLKKNTSKARKFIPIECKTQATSIKNEYPQRPGAYNQSFTICLKYVNERLNYIVN